MPFSSVLGASSVIKPGVCTSTTRPSVPYTGQLIYETDTASVASWNGSAWVYTHSSGLVYVTGASFSAAASVSVNNCFTSAYRNYRIIVEGAGSLSGGAFVDWRFRVGGADNSTNNYFYSYNTVDASSTETNVGAGSQTAFRIGNAASIGFGFDITVTSPQLAATHTINTLFSSAGSAIGITGRAGGTFNTATSFDGFSLLPASGTITGTYRVYGLADS